MNGEQQRQHRRATDTLAQVITETQGAVVERFEEMEASFAAMHERFAREQTLHGDVHTMLLDEMASLRRTFCNLRMDMYSYWHQTTFWGRLRWLIRGH